MSLLYRTNYASRFGMRCDSRAVAPSLVKRGRAGEGAMIFVGELHQLDQLHSAC